MCGEGGYYSYTPHKTPLNECLSLTLNQGSLIECVCVCYTINLSSFSLEVSCPFRVSKDKMYDWVENYQKK